VFTFDSLKRYPAINTYGINFSSVKALNKYEVQFQLPAPSASEFYYIASTYIVPEHIWKSVNPSTYADTNPVGTGPYVLKTFSSTDIQLMANPHYWGGAPHVQVLNFPMSDSNLAADNMMAAGGAQWGGHNFGDVAKLYVSKDPKYRHFWYIPTTTIQILPNLTQYPLNNVDFRKALSDVVDRKAIQNEAEFGHELAIQSPTGLLPKFDSFMAPQFKGMRYSVNLSAARSLLAKAGFKRNGSGELVGTDGRPVSLTMVLPSPYADWLTIGGILTSELKAIGINLTVQSVSLPTWQADEALGRFELTLNVGNFAGPSQYYIYNGLLNDQLSAAIGQTATGDLERWRSPVTQKLLAEYESGTSAQQRAALYGLEATVVNDVPYVPIINQSGWFQYSNRQFVGWPTPKDAYAAGMPNGLNAEVVVLHLRPRS
jgi:peptide/nickel transport system substrate-binding protein